MPQIPIEEILTHFKNVKQASSGWSALCPGHEDLANSLAISEGDDDRVLLHCFAGCSFDAVCKGAGLKPSDLMPKRSEPPTSTKPRIVEVYDYEDADGKKIYQALRYEPGHDGKKKDFRQRKAVTRPGYAGWEWNMKGVTKVLYRLPKIAEAIKKGETIFLVEGERKANYIEKLGLTGTCNVGGACSNQKGKKWLPQYTTSLAEANVVILPDNDGPGRQHARFVAKELFKKVASIKIVELPDLQPKGDIVDWVKAGGTREQLDRLVEQAPFWEPSIDGSVMMDFRSFEPTVRSSALSPSRHGPLS